MEKKILIALDDSENALRAVEYVANSFNTDHSITLFSVVLDTPAICDMNSPSLTPYFLSQKETFCLLEDQKKLLAKEALQKAKELLLKAGFEERKVTIKVVDKKKGIARGIVNEANADYDTIVLGRRGLSSIKEFFLGSVPLKVLQSAGNISVLLVN